MNDYPSENNSKGPVTEALVKEVGQFIQSEFGDRLLQVSTEIQDGHKFLLVSLSIEGATPVHDALRMLELTSAEVSRRVPPREGEYSWMVNIKHGGEVLRSASGGWRGKPNV